MDFSVIRNVYLKSSENRILELLSKNNSFINIVEGALMNSKRYSKSRVEEIIEEVNTIVREFNTQKEVGKEGYILFVDKKDIIRHKIKIYTQNTFSVSHSSLKEYYPKEIISEERLLLKKELDINNFTIFNNRLCYEDELEAFQIGYKTLNLNLGRTRAEEITWEINKKFNVILVKISFLFNYKKDKEKYCEMVYLLNLDPIKIDLLQDK